MATRLYYSMREPTPFALQAIPISASWDSGYWSYSYENGWEHFPPANNLFGRVTDQKIPFGPEDIENNQYNIKEIYASQGLTPGGGWYPCPNGVTCDPPFKAFGAQFFSDPLRAQTIDGNVLGQMLCTECFEDREGWWPACGALSDSCRSIVIRVFSGDLAVERGVLLEHFPANLVSEFPEGIWEWDDPEHAETPYPGSYKPKQNRNFPPSSAITPVACEDGDIIVVEIGFKAFGDLDPELTDWLQHQIQFSFYHNAASDLPVDETTTEELDAWLELDSDIEFQHPTKNFAISDYMVTEGVGYCKYRSYVGFCETEIRAPGIYGQPVVGVDDKAGYGLVDLSFLDGDAPHNMVSVFPLHMAPQAEVTKAEAPVVVVGWVGSGGFAMGGEGIFDSKTPPVDAVISDGGFKFCGLETTGNLSTTHPPRAVLVGSGGFKFGGSGWGDKSAAPTATVLVGSGGFKFGGSGWPVTQAPLPTATVIVGSGGFKFGGFSPNSMEVTYPEILAKSFPDSEAALIMGGAGIWGGSLPTNTIIVSDGAVFKMSGAGSLSVKSPPLAVITGDGGFVMGGSGWPVEEETYEAWVLSGQSFEPSMFSAFKFNSFAQRRSQSFAAGDKGIYLLGGTDDDGEPFHTGARIGPTNFGHDRDKRLRGIQFGSAGPDTKVRVESETGQDVFTPDRDDNRVVVSRDIQGREFTIDIVDFLELSQLEITPLWLARR